MRWLVLALIGVAASGALAVRQGWVDVPERWNPWAPLRLESPPDLFTRLKLRRLSEEPAACLAFLATTPLRYTPLPDRITGEGCAIEDAVRIEAITPETTAEPFSLSCRAAASLALWWHHSVAPAARAQLGGPVVRLEHFGSYACRNVYNREEGSRSRHATAEALDVAGFVISKTKRVRVVRDWSPETSEGVFLHAVRDGACRWFDGVFSPDYNAAHHDHLHLDRGPYRLCR